jgi:hypothetical protein
VIRLLAAIILSFVVVCPIVAGTAFNLTVLKPNSNNSTLCVADIDGDRKGDIVSNNSDGYLSWRRYPNWGTEYMIDTNHIGYGGIQVADVDGDGDIDVLAVTGDPIAPLTGHIYWWENPLPVVNPTMSTNMWVRHEICACFHFDPGSIEYVHDFYIGDVNHDGKIDCVGNCQYGTKYPDFYLFVQNSPDSWTEVDVGPLRSEEGTWVADINGDGRDDLIDGMDWYEAPADPIHDKWARHHINDFPTGKMRTNVGDFNGDHRLDVVTSVSEFEVGPLAWYEAPADIENGTWIEHILVQPADLNFHTLQVGDMDGDGNLDIVTGATHGCWDATNQIETCGEPDYRKHMIIFYGDGHGNFRDTTWITRNGVWGANIGDVGSDGDLDIVNCDYGPAENGMPQEELWENQLNPATGIAFGPRLPVVLKGKPAFAKQQSPLFLLNGRRAAVAGKNDKTAQLEIFFKGKENSKALSLTK